MAKGHNLSVGRPTAGIFCALLAIMMFSPVFSARSAENRPPARSSSAPSIPDADTVVILLRASLLSLNDALQTGNFTVLRDQAAPSFRDLNNPARLAGIFAPLAERRLDLLPVAIVAPRLTDIPALDPSGRLRLKGNFPTQPEQINFDLTYEWAESRWKIFGLSVATAAPPKK